MNLCRRPVALNLTKCFKTTVSVCLKATPQNLPEHNNASGPQWKRPQCGSDTEIQQDRFLQQTIGRAYNTRSLCERLLHPHKCCKRRFSTFATEDEEPTEDDIDEFLLWDKKYTQVFTEHYLVPSGGQRVFVLQPDIKSGPKRPRLTTPALQMAEACALVETLPRWKVVDQGIYALKHQDKKHLFTSGKFEEIRTRLRETQGVSAVFVGIDMLTGLQLSMVQQAWRVPVYDRYTIVLQIFKTHARTKEAKLQVALAEIPYFRSRLRGLHMGSLDQQRGGMSYIGGSGETYLETRQRLLQERELKLKKAVARVRQKRQLLRKERAKREFPVVAVVGYTNAGKTSLIKALTGERSLQPRNQLFATLDVTAHAGLLPSHMTVLFMDTVGFISDIPTSLVQSFSATLEDIVNADLILHIRDISHPDSAAQKANVLQTLQDLSLPEELRCNIVEVCNKVDLLTGPVEPSDGEQLHISATRGQGIHQLQAVIQDRVIAATGRVRKKLRLPMSGTHLSWLYKEATIEKAVPDSSDPEYLLVDSIMTEAVYAKFRAQFTNSKNTEPAKVKRPR